MKKVTTIKQRLLVLLQKEEAKTNEEIVDLRNKQQSNISYYGLSGPYQRYEKAIRHREELLSELKAMRENMNTASVLLPMRLYGYYCPSCEEKIFLQSRNPETVDCPLCTRRIYRDGIYTQWNVQKSSQYTRLH